MNRIGFETESQFNKITSASLTVLTISHSEWNIYRFPYQSKSIEKFFPLLIFQELKYNLFAEPNRKWLFIVRIGFQNGICFQFWQCRQVCTHFTLNATRYSALTKLIKILRFRFQFISQWKYIWWKCSLGYITCDNLIWCAPRRQNSPSMKSTW